MLQPYFHRHTVIRDHDTYDLAHGPPASMVGPRPGAMHLIDEDDGRRYTLSRKQTIYNLTAAAMCMRGHTTESANRRWNPDGDPAVDKLIRRLLTPGLHMCGLQVTR